MRILLNPPSSPMEAPWNPWQCHVSPIKVPWESHGNTIIPWKLVWDYPGNTMEIPWKSRGITMQVPMEYYSPVKVPLKPYGSAIDTSLPSWKHHGSIMEAPWTLSPTQVSSGSDGSTMDAPRTQWDSRSPMEAPIPSGVHRRSIGVMSPLCVPMDALQSHENPLKSHGIAWGSHEGTIIPWCLHGTLVLPWLSHGTSMEIPSFSHPMGLPRKFHRSLIGLPWNSHENSVLVSWDVRGTRVGLPRCFHETSIVFAWDYHGTPFDYPW